MKFAIYYIPKEGQFYKLGSQIIGHDIRKKKSLKSPFNLKITKDIRKYGFHVTLTDAVQIDPKKLKNIEEDLENILKCFPKDFKFKLTASKPSISRWGNGNKQIALMLTPNIPTIIIHCVLASIIQSQGQWSWYSNNLLTNPKKLKKLPKDKIQKIKMFCSPYIFDEFKPHFTLISPTNTLKESEQETIVKILNKTFEKEKVFEINSLCLVKQNKPHENFTIYKEFNI